MTSPKEETSMFSDESGSLFSNLMGMISSVTGASGSAETASPSGKADTPPATAPPENMEQIPGMGPYLGFCRNDKAKAWALYSHGQAIRKELGLDTILHEPYPHWDVLKEHYQKAIHGRSKNGEIVLVECIGRMDLASLKKAGITRKEIVRYYCLFFEFILQHIGDQESKVLMIYDLEGLGLFSVLNGDFLGTVRMLSDCLGALYPRVITKYVLVRPPALFQSLWGLVSGVLPAGARNDCVLCKSAQDLEVLLARENIPAEYGGSSDRLLGDAEEMRRLKAHLQSKQAGQ